MFSSWVQTPIITSVHVPRFESFMWMAVPKLFRFPWQKRYTVYERKRTWYGIYRMRDGGRDVVVCHPSDWERMKAIAK